MLFQIIASLILLTFYGCYFGKMILQRRQGIQTDQMGRGKVGFVRFVEIATKAMAVLLPVLELVCIFLLPSRSLPWMQWLGAALGLLGLAAFVTSVLTMKDSWRAGVSETDQTALVTSGIYRWSRNPAFLGFDLVYVGILLMFFQWFLLAATLVTILMFHLQIVNVEEEHLAKAFGDDYLRYKKQVCRYFGRRG